MSSFLFSASVTLALLYTAFAGIIPYPFDIDGDIIDNNREYYIIPVNSTSGLTYTQKHNECPLYITQEKTENSPGTPVKVFVPVNQASIVLNAALFFAFKEPKPCDESLMWIPTLDESSRKLYITTGGEFSVPNMLLFGIANDDRIRKPIYMLKYWPTLTTEEWLDVGFHEDGLLGVTENSMFVSFKKASFQSSTS